MVRKFKIHGEDADITSVLEYLEDLLLNNGNTEMWEEIGIDFEDVEE